MVKRKTDVSLSIWQSFICSVICIIVIPILPLLIEFIFNNHIVSFKSIALVCTILVLSIGVASQFVAVFLISSVCGIIEMAFYAQVTNTDFKDGQYIVGICAIMIFMHIIERFYRHIIKKEKFLEWGNI